MWQLETYNLSLSEELRAREQREEKDVENHAVIANMQQDIDQLQERNAMLIDQLQARDDEFQSTLLTLEEMRSALSLANDASMKATADLEHRWVSEWWDRL